MNIFQSLPVLIPKAAFTREKPLWNLPEKGIVKSIIPPMAQTRYREENIILPF